MSRATPAWPSGSAIWSAAADRPERKIPGAASPGYNPYRAWPTAYEGLETTFARDLPEVWRPTAEQLPLWRAFSGDWDRLDCVAAPGDRRIELPPLSGPAASAWSAVAACTPALLEVAGLPAPEAPDINQPLLYFLEDLLTPLLSGEFTPVEARYDSVGDSSEEHRVSSAAPTGDRSWPYWQPATKPSTMPPRWSSASPRP